MYNLGMTMRHHETPSKNIRVLEICRQRGLSKPTLYKAIKEGRFPAPQSVGRIFQWDREMVDDWFKAGGIQ
jgi:DNA binding domain, excisionase family